MPLKGAPLSRLIASRELIFFSFFFTENYYQFRGRDYRTFNAILIIFQVSFNPFQSFPKVETFTEENLVKVSLIRSDIFKFQLSCCCAFFII